MILALIIQFVGVALLVYYAIIAILFLSGEYYVNNTLKDTKSFKRALIPFKMWYDLIVLRLNELKERDNIKTK